MKKLAAMLGVLIGVILATLATLYGIGLALPPEHTATVRTEVDAPPPRVWEVLGDWEAWPAWHPGVDAVAIEGGDPLRLAVTGRWGATTPWEVAEAYPPERLRLRTADPQAAHGGLWTWRIEPTDDGSRITLTEDGEVSDPLLRALSRYVIGHAEPLRDALDGLAGALGEETRVDVITAE